MKAGQKHQPQAHWLKVRYGNIRSYSAFYTTTMRPPHLHIYFYTLSSQARLFFKICTTGMAIRSTTAALVAFYVVYFTLSQICSASTSLTESRFATTVGEWSVDVLNDGNLRFPSNPFSVPLEISLRAFYFYRPLDDPYEFSQNVALLRRGNLKVLIDSGSGRTPSPLGVAGKLPIRLGEVGVQPADITHIVLTHAHGDHLGGLVTPEGGAVFPNATVIMTHQEYSFWSSPVDRIKATASMVPPKFLGTCLSLFE